MDEAAREMPDVEPGQIHQGRGWTGWFVHGGRLRSGWRVTLYLVVARVLDLAGSIALGLVLGLAIGLVLYRQGIPPAEVPARIAGYFFNIYDHPSLILVFQAGRLVLVLALVWIFRRWIDRRSFRSLGLQLRGGWWQEMLGGFGFSMAGWAVIFALSLGLGAAAVMSFEWTVGNSLAVLGSLGYGLLLNLMVGVTEETDARGYVLQNLAEGIRFWPAVAVSSLYFGLLHLLNPGAGLTSTVGIFFAGILLALGYYATGRLWFSIGMHAAWNFAEGPVFGFLVSGLNMGGLFRLKITGPDWLMGGSFGPEAGALAVAVEIGMIVVLLAWTKKTRSGPLIS